MQNSKWLVIIFIKDISERRTAITRWLRSFQQINFPAFLQVVILRETVEVEENINVNAISYCVESYQIIGRATKKISPPGIPKNTKDSITRLFEWILKNFEADRRLVYTLSHGGAYGIYYSILTGVFKRPFIIDFNDHLIIRNIPKSFEGKTQEFLAIDGVSLGNNKEIIINRKKVKAICRNLEILWMAELGQIIERSLPHDKKIDVLIMNNCYMQLFDNGYILRNCVSNLVAAETAMQALDYDMLKLYRRIIDNRDITEDKLLTSIIDDFARKPDSDLQEYTALFACKLEKYQDLLKEFDSILIELLSMDIIRIKLALKNIFNKRIEQIDENAHYTNSLFDALTVFDFLADELNHPSLKIKVEKFSKIFIDEIRHKRYHIGKELINNDNIPNAAVMRPNGISIGFPRSKEEMCSNTLLFCSYWGDAIRSPFANNSKWDEFLSKLYP